MKSWKVGQFVADMFGGGNLADKECGGRCLEGGFTRFCQLYVREVYVWCFGC